MVRRSLVGLTAALGAVSLLLAPAASARSSLEVPAGPEAQEPLHEKAEQRWRTVREGCGKRLPGRNVVRDGIRPGRAATDAQVLRWSRRLRRLHRTCATSSARPTAGRPRSRSRRAAERGSGVGRRQGGCGGGYRGLFQFTCETWRSVGCSGDPAAASTSVQYDCARRLLRREGSSPWPNCGSRDLDAIARCESGGQRGRRRIGRRPSRLQAAAFRRALRAR